MSEHIPTPLCLIHTIDVASQDEISRHLGAMGVVVVGHVGSIRQTPPSNDDDAHDDSHDDDDDSHDDRGMKTKRRANDRDTTTTTTRETTTRETSDVARRAVNHHHHVDDDATTTTTETTETTETTTAGTKKRRLGVKNLAQFKNRAFDKPSMFIRQWGWKREMKTDEERFALDYAHAFKDVDGCAHELKFKQKKFGPEGFASTVWDSAIVMAKYIEKTYEKFRHARSAIELGAGCGVTTAVLAVGLKMETVVSTELKGNLELLNANVGAFENVRCAEMTWGSETDAKNALPSDGEAFDVVVASDCVYHTEAMGDLVKTLEIICDARTRVLFSYGRNRQALDIFMDEIAGKFSRVDVSSSDLDELYQCTDVSVIELRKL